MCAGKIYKLTMHAEDQQLDELKQDFEAAQQVIYL
jgi:hypothetical protein